MELWGILGGLFALGGFAGGWLHLITRFRRRLAVTEDERLAASALDQVQVLESRLDAALGRIAELESERLTSGGDPTLLHSAGDDTS